MNLKSSLLLCGLAISLILSPRIYSQSYFSTAEIAVSADAQNKIVGVRLTDILSNYPALVPNLANIANILKKSPEVFFNQDKIDEVRGVFFSKIPEAGDGFVKLNLVGFVKYKNKAINFEKLTVTYGFSAKKAEEVFVQNDGIYPLAEMLFHINVGLLHRKIIIEDTVKDIKLVFPIGVGAFDEGVMNEGVVSLVTPRIKNGFIDQRAVISKRSKPRYFQGLPFIRVLKGRDLVKDTTPIGFHIEINDSFVRGFDSHGCIRLREQDLMAFHDLIVLGAHQQTPINMSYNTQDPADHPEPKRNKVYKTVLNKGSDQSPFFIYDRDNLVQMVYKEAMAPLDQLIDQENDNYFDLLSYDTDSQLREQEVRRKNECDAKVMSGELSIEPKKYQKCIDEGKRKDSFKDKIYRKYMGIEDVAPTVTVEFVKRDLF